MLNNSNTIMAMMIGPTDRNEQPMPLATMLTTTAVNFNEAIDPCNEARLLYNIVCNNKSTEQILYANKLITTATLYEQHEIYANSFDVFYGALTNRPQFQQMCDEVRRKGQTEGKMILYDKKNKPFYANLIMKPIISVNDYEELIISHYLITMKRMSEEVDQPTPVRINDSESVAATVSDVASSNGLSDNGERRDQQCMTTNSENDSARTSSLSILSAASSQALSENDNEEEMCSSAQDPTQSDSTSISGQKRTKRGNQMMNDTNNEIEQPDKKRLTLNALKQHDDRSAAELNTTKRSKFMASH